MRYALVGCAQPDVFREGPAVSGRYERVRGMQSGVPAGTPASVQAT